MGNLPKEMGKDPCNPKNATGDNMAYALSIICRGNHILLVEVSKNSENRSSKVRVFSPQGYINFIAMLFS